MDWQVAEIGMEQRSRERVAILVHWCLREGLEWYWLRGRQEAVMESVAGEREVWLRPVGRDLFAASRWQVDVLLRVAYELWDPCCLSCSASTTRRVASSYDPWRPSKSSSFSSYPDTSQGSVGRVEN
jgi:hypothetical protein